MPTKLEDAEDIILGKVDQICGRFGLNNIMAQLYSVLYLHNKPLSLSKLAERLKISKGSASVNVRALERYGAVRKVWVKGTRQDYYEAEYDIAKVIIRRAKSMVQNRFSEIDGMIQLASEALISLKPESGTEQEAIEVFKAKLEKLKNLYDKAKNLFDLFDTYMANNVPAEPAGISHSPSVQEDKENSM